MRFYPTTVQAPPTDEPITLTEAKLQTRVTHSDEDALLNRCIRSAREYCETYTRRKFLTQTVRMTIDWGFPHVLFLPFGKTQSVPSTTFTYVDTNGVVTEVPASLYVLDKISDDARVHLDFDQVWPTPRIQRSTISIDWVSGYGDAGSDLPGNLLQAVFAMCAHYYEVRQPELLTIGGVVSKFSKAADDLMNPYVKHYH